MRPREPLLRESPVGSLAAGIPRPPDRLPRALVTDPASEDDERWVRVSSSKNYWISDQGRVYNWATKRYLKGSINAYGYRHLRIDGRERTVHGLVAQEFLGPRPVGLETRHLDGDRLNNTVGNLAYGTRSQNQQDRKRHGTYQYGELNPRSGLTWADVRRIRLANASGVGYKKLAKTFSVTASCIQHICTERTWVEATIDQPEEVAGGTGSPA